MKVIVRKVENVSGQKRDGSAYNGCKVLMTFEDGATALKTYIDEEIISPEEVKPGAAYDLWRDESGRVLIFDKITEERR